MGHVVANWGTKDIGDLAGKRALVTGANSGIGYHTALELGRAGAHVVVACRDRGRGEKAVADMAAAVPHGSFRLEILDLASLASIRAFAERLATETIDVLVANAGIMALPKREVTADGFERQFGTNHLGHFALVGLLLPALRRSDASRVVTVSSGLAYVGKMHLDDLGSEKGYVPYLVYSMTKLANLLFMIELGRRHPWITSVAAHPGTTHTNLQQHGGFWTRMSMSLMGQSAAEGALPSLYACVGEVKSGEFYGPSKLFSMNGPPRQVKLPGRAKSVDDAAALWRASEELTAVRYELPARQTG